MMGESFLLLTQLNCTFLCAAVARLMVKDYTLVVGNFSGRWLSSCQKLWGRFLLPLQLSGIFRDAALSTRSEFFGTLLSTGWDFLGTLPSVRHFV